MKLKEKTAYALGFVIIMYGAFVGRDFSNSSDVLEGIMMVALFVGVFLVFLH